MIPISSELEGQEKKFTEMHALLAEHRFALGGSWDYHSGSFDRPLDEKHEVWLRIPFQVTDGNIDSEMSENNARIRFGTPYLLRHLYREGNDPEASLRVFGALFDQFQSPADPDAEMDSRWIDEGKSLLSRIEAVIPTA